MQKRKTFHYTYSLGLIMLLSLYNVQASSIGDADSIIELTNRDREKASLRKWLDQQKAISELDPLEQQNLYKPSGTTQDIGLQVDGYSRYDDNIQTQSDIDNIEEFRRKARKNEIEDIAVNVSVGLGVAAFIILLVYTSRDNKKNEE